MSTGITGSQPRSGDPSGAGTLTQRKASFLTTTKGNKMAIAISTLATVVLVVLFQVAKEIIHREQVARDCWMARNSIQRIKR
jgi:DNA-binding winged helix-turn-helix (wHTH) protein